MTILLKLTYRFYEIATKITSYYPFLFCVHVEQNNSKLPKEKCHDNII